MKHELLRLYLRIGIFFLRKCCVYDDMDFWWEFLAPDDPLDPHDDMASTEDVVVWREARLFEKRDTWISARVVEIYNRIFTRGTLMPSTASQEEGEMALKSIHEPDGYGSQLAFNFEESLDKSR